ncbi:hypothetical protein Snoj_18570 [Streptomyces nojiriensis]|uniref:Uncharacterized protein n=1 Tax=Streptomyces nojiriensis TaxID=66374 RepID=A0ABQ3SIP3_9ACTN|nr:hypothetical protein GCM10010205_63480 [Streptomyces nojiriensis]GHI67939.1 hypothetical protein Snoj_18570 [Streptomyces nojiriensis]
MCGRTYRISCRIVGSTELRATNARGAFAADGGALAPAGVAATAAVRAAARAVTVTARRALIGGKDVEPVIRASSGGAVGT